MNVRSFDNLLVHLFGREIKGFVDPLFGDGIVKDLDVEVGFVREAIHDGHHCNLSDEKHFRIGAKAIAMDSHGIDDQGITSSLVLDMIAEVKAESRI